MFSLRKRFDSFSSKKSFEFFIIGIALLCNQTIYIINKIMYAEGGLVPGG